MDSRFMIDAVVRQTTLLIAQLATSAGIRAPLAHLADQVFLELSREIEQQGVSKKVAADMFGLALRSYQRKVSRLGESATVAEKTLWQAVLEHVTRSHDAVPRSHILSAFARDDETAVIAVLSDLVASGLLYSTGRGRHAAYVATSRGDQDVLLRERSFEALVHCVWLELAVTPGKSREELLVRLADYESSLDRALTVLVEDGRAQSQWVDGVERFRSAPVLIPVGQEAGWETAVLDHFRAVCTAMIGKLAGGGSRRAQDELVGGATLSFELSPGHPLEAEVKGLLRRVRAEVSDLWQRVADHNAKSPLPEESLERVIFYVGQNHIVPETDPSVEG